jgi:hypothetical protein
MPRAILKVLAGLDVNRYLASLYGFLGCVRCAALAM